MRTLPLLLLVGCAAPDAGQLFYSVNTHVTDGPDETVGYFVDAIAKAETKVDIAFPKGEDTRLSDALIAAYDRGVEVKVVTDIDEADSAAVSELIAAGVPTTLADAGISYFEFLLGDTVSWPSEQTIMSHAFAVIDYEVTDYQYTEPKVVQASSVGSLAEGPRVVFEARGEELAEDLWIEHHQVFGGADCTAATAYDAMAKSIADSRYRYDTSSNVELQVWFGPQERLIKRVTDAVYSARSDVRILTDDFATEGLAFALQDKASWGFDVDVIVGPNFSASSTALSRTLSNSTPDVAKFQTSMEQVPTVILIDYGEDLSGRYNTSRALVITHDLYSSSRLYRSQEVVNDQLIDGAMWELRVYGEPSGDLLDLEQLWKDARADAEVL
ncbi:MAG: hypothetical protein JXX28_13005 [Deltaproteobacteria bacterium]|nr:hypothetical protein [Deltaproteobacteria bacterium]